MAGGGEGLRVDGGRLWQRLMRLAEIGATCKGGVDRQALSDGEHEAWRLLIGWAEDAGMRPSTDAAANLFLALPGSTPELPPILIGSHIDSQPTGGKFDGAFGVLAALEAATAISEGGIQPPRDIIVVAWMNEEGSRFAPGMMGSEAFAGVRSLEVIRSARDQAGISVGEEIDRIHAAFPGLERRPLGFKPFAYIEPHIEQDIVLERENKVIGVVTGIQGKKTFEIRISGEKGHAGTVAMTERKDAVLAFARIAAALESEIGRADPDVKFTIGRVEVHPNAPSVIPEQVTFRVDLRHPDNEALDRFGDTVRNLPASHAAPCRSMVTELVSAPSNSFDPSLQERIAAAARRRGYPAIPLLSCAGHDARHMAPLCPSAMIFIPCRGGISHAENEWAEPAHVTAGGQVLVDVVLDLLSCPDDLIRRGSWNL